MAITVSGYKGERRTYGALPPQKISSSRKNSKEWKQSNIDAIIAMAQLGEGNGRSSRANKQVNYDLINSRFKQSDFAHVLNPYGVTDTRFIGAATKMQNYNILRQPFETLKGEEMKLGMEFRAVAVNGAATLEKNAERQSAIIEAIKARMMAVATDDIDPETGEPAGPDPEEVAKIYKTEYAHPTEIAVNKLLKFLVKKDRLQMKFSKGWEHALISAEEIYFLGIVDGHPSIRVCNPLNVSFDKDSDDPFIHHGDWAMEERYMTRGSIIDTYGDSLDDETVRMLDSGELGGTTRANGTFPGFAYTFDGGARLDSSNSQDTSHVYVAHCTWRSWRKLGKLTYIDPRTNMLEATTVDDTFSMTPDLEELGAIVDWYWETEIWEGVRIGNDRYVNIGPMENQTGNLPYVGYIYNNVNSVATSLIDMVKAHQYTYIITWYRLEQELAKAKGKKFVMDLAQIPKSKGWTIDQWMYYFDNQGVAWVNSMEEGRKGDPNTLSKFNQFQAIDMTLSQSIGQYMSILQKLEEQVEKITGVSPQRAGDIGKSETATGAQRAILHSTNNTKPLYFYHDIVRETVLGELVELCKVAYADGANIEYAVDQKTIDTIKVDSGMLTGTDLGVFMSNSFEDAENLEKLEAYLGVALQYDKANLSDIVSVLGTKSISEVRDTIVAGERDKFARDAKAGEEAAESQRQALEAAAMEKQADREHQILLEDMKIQGKLEEVILKAELESPEKDNSESEMVKSELAERKLRIDEKFKAQDMSLKEKSLAETKRSNLAKEQIAKNKPKPSSK